jgi:SnoaL-like domain
MPGGLGVGYRRRAVDEELRAYLGVTRLQSAYADVISRRAWDELEALFEPHAPIHVDTVTAETMHFTGPKEFAAFVARSTERFDFFEFVVLNTVVDVQPGPSATGRLWMVELRQDRASGGWSNAFGVYQDSYAMTDGAWRFSERHYQSLARTGRAEVFPFPSPP